MTLHSSERTVMQFSNEKFVFNYVTMAVIFQAGVATFKARSACVVRSTGVLVD